MGLFPLILLIAVLHGRMGHADFIVIYRQIM